jgi:hypothetical protein
MEQVHIKGEQICPMLRINSHQVNALKRGASGGVRLDKKGFVQNLTCIFQGFVHRNRFVKNEPGGLFLEYARSPNEDTHKAMLNQLEMMKQLGATVPPFPVHVGVSGGGDFVWGFCVLDAWLEDGNRFRVRRVSEARLRDGEIVPSEQGSSDGDDGSSSGSSSLGEEDGPVPSPTPTAPDAPSPTPDATDATDAPSPTPTKQVYSYTKKMAWSDSAAPLDNNRSSYSVEAKPTSYGGHRYDSVLEARVAVFLTSLCISYSPHCVIYRINKPAHLLSEGDPDNPSKSPREYTPDFTIPNMVVEVKPTYPTDDEMRRCECVACHCLMSIVCLYGDPGVMPYRAEGGQKRDRDHQRGMRGLLWEAGAKTCRVVVWMWDEERKRAFLGPRTGVDDLRWNHTVIREGAYAARNASFH